jgi:hypothetical protein
MVSTTTTERETERDRFIWLYNNCQSRVAVPAGVSPDADSKHAVFEDTTDTTETRPLTTADVKVTVKWSTQTSNNELAHLAQIDSNPHYKLGIRFERWRRQDPEEKLVTLGHELGHARYPGHERYYWQFVLDIWQSMLNHKQTLSSWFDTDLNWDYMRSCMIDNIYGNASAVQRSDLMQFAGRKLDYDPDWTQILDWGRGVRETTSHWAVDTITRVSGDRITLSRSYSDEELVEFYTSLETPRDITEVPVVKGTVTPSRLVTLSQNEIVAALILRTQYNPIVPVALS